MADHDDTPDGTDFRVNVHTDVPQLRVRSERGPQGDRYQNSLTFAKG